MGFHPLGVGTESNLDWETGIKTPPFMTPFNVDLPLPRRRMVAPQYVSEHEVST